MYSERIVDSDFIVSFLVSFGSDKAHDKARDTVVQTRVSEFSSVRTISGRREYPKRRRSQGIVDPPGPQTAESKVSKNLWLTPVPLSAIGHEAVLLLRPGPVFVPPRSSDARTTIDILSVVKRQAPFHTSLGRLQKSHWPGCL